MALLWFHVCFGEGLAFQLIVSTPSRTTSYAVSSYYQAYPKP